MKKELKCMSCSKRIMNESSGVRFMCPNCGKQEIIRCGHCRELAAKYTCPECNFQGPN